MENDLYQMQQEAARRVQNMQERALRSAQIPGEPPPKAPEPTVPTVETGLGKLLSDEKSNDGMLILILLLLLTEDGAEPSLLLALLYLFL